MVEKSRIEHNWQTKFGVISVTYMISFDKRTNIKKDFKKPSTKKWIRLTRSSTREDVKKQKLEKMPGFRVSWYYSGPHVEPEAHLNKMNDYDDETSLFVRNR